MYSLAVLTCLVDPTSNGTSLEAEGGYYCLHWTTMCHQVYYQRDSLRLSVCPVVGRAFRVREGFPTDVTDVPACAMAMHSDVAQAPLSTCTAGQVRAKYLLRVHGRPPEFVALRDFTWIRVF